MGCSADFVTKLPVRGAARGFANRFRVAFGGAKGGVGDYSARRQYCVCDPGPVTPNCQAPRLDHWCLGAWLDVDTGLNSENDIGKGHFAVTRGENAD